MAHISVCHNASTVWISRPDDVVDRVDILQERGNAFETISQLGTDGIEIYASTLLEVGELSDLKAIQHHLPTDAPSAERGRFPVVFLKLDVMLAKINADGGKRFQVSFLHSFWRRLENHLELHVLI